MMSTLRSLLFLLYQLVVTPCYAALMLATCWLPRIPRYNMAKSWCRANLRGARWICGIRWRVEGLDNVPSTPHIVMSKHSSTWETLALNLYFPPLAFVAKKELLSIPFFGWGFALAGLNAFALYLLPPNATLGMLLLAITGSIVYAPTIAVAWAMYADAADYSEWQTGRRFTGMVFATIGFSLKSGLALGSALFLWIMAGVFSYDTQQPSATNAIAGYHVSSSIFVGLLFLGGALSIAACKLNKTLTLQMAEELAARRAKAAAQAAVPA